MRLQLIRQLVGREIQSRYKGAFLGILWAALTPLMMLALYAFVFGGVLKTTWPKAVAPSMSGTPAMGDTVSFAVIVFVGLILYNLFSEIVIRAPSLILDNVNYVKKVVFPLETLVAVAIGSATINAGISLVVLCGFLLFATGALPITAILLPLIVLPLLLMCAGVGWFLASIGVYVRDIRQLIGPIANGLMFLSPIFFPLSALPDWIQGWIYLNPLTLPVEEARNVLLWGALPNWSALAIYTLASVIVAYFGYLWFAVTRRGFADVI